MGVAGAAQALSPLVGKSVPALMKALTGNRGYMIVAKGIEPAVWREVDDLNIPGLDGVQADLRTYPANEVGASVVGFLSADGETALSGIERSEDKLLKGTAGRTTYEKGKGGQEIATGVSTEVAPVAGDTVQLTINADLQYRAQELLAAQAKLVKAKSGSAVIMDIRTGEILALADVPTFNANTPGKAAVADRGNRSLNDVFEPGSTSKVITAAAAIEEGKASASTRLTVPGTINVGGRTFHDSEVHGDEQLTFAGVLAKSSNVGTIKIGSRLSPATLYSYLTKFGIGAKTGVGLPESAGLLAPYQDWSNSQRYTVLFGQGLSVTSLQSASVFATIANNGVRLTPRLIKSITTADGTTVPQPAQTRTRVISAATAKTLRLMMEGVVSDNGTAVKATIPGYRVAGKTGTAQYYDPKVGGYNGYTASFVGIAPADKPRLVVGVWLQQPTDNHYGGTAAAPVFHDLMTYALQQENVPPTLTKAPKVPLEWP
jgi:cell division protein FtsI (penicillin-binding protein 3)